MYIKIGKIIDIKKECEAIIENQMIDTLLFYFQEYPEQREEFCTELIKTMTETIYQLKKEIEEAETEDE